ncbi:MAG TPA: phosphoribosylamine--glycine ligase [Polyangia bacterium]
MGSAILLVGSGGREHALAWKLLRSPSCERLIVAPGNPGIAALGLPGALGEGRLRIADVSGDDTAALIALARVEKLDLVVCGPEAQLATGLGDAFRAAGFDFFGPSQAASEIEGSKAYAKALMQAAGVPTAAFASFDDVAAAERFIDAQAGDVVVKADGLCAGKGVVVTSSHAEAKAAVREMLGERRFGQAGARVVIEERLSGPEVSLFAFCDGERFALLATAEDHKAVFDGDRGPNTGGMGAYSPSPLVDQTMIDEIARRIFAPTVRALAAAGRPFRGLLYGGLMLTSRGPMVIEWNCRFGDPETQAVLLRMEDDIVPWLRGAARGQLPDGAPRFGASTSVCVVLASEGYPGKLRLGDRIAGLVANGSANGHPDVVVFHAGTKAGPEGSFLTAGGRVLGVSAVGSDLTAARAKAYGAIADISWPGMHHRQDIGLRKRN